MQLLIILSNIEHCCTSCLEVAEQIEKSNTEKLLSLIKFCVSIDVEVYCVEEKVVSTYRQNRRKSGS